MYQSAYYTLTERTGHAKLQPRSTSPLGLFSSYDGNIIGGSLLGAGMALSGSCPGTLFAQMAAGVHTGFYALNGAIVGGVLWTGLFSGMAARQKQRTGVKPQPVTVDSLLGVSKTTVRMLYEAMFAAIIVTTTLYTARFPGAKVSGAVGGLLISLSQLVSLVTRKSMVGISGSYEELGNYFWWAIKGADAQTRPRSTQNMLFALSAGAGAWALAKAVPSLVALPPLEVAPAMATLGGALMIVGSRLAGGCTSGHGISGISLLSASSLVTIASTFAAGGVVAKLLY